jgi:hypothetical protein
MAIITTGVLIYAKFLGTDELAGDRHRTRHRCRRTTTGPRSATTPPRSRLLGWAVLVFAWLFAPLVVIVAFSFNEPTGKFNTAWNQFTFDNWLHPFRKADYTEALITSLKVAAVACVLATSWAVSWPGALPLPSSGARAGQHHPGAAAHHARDRDGLVAVHPVLRPSTSTSASGRW